MGASRKSFCSPLTVVQLPFPTLASVFHEKCDLLKARVVIYAYQHHVRLLSPEKPGCVPGRSSTISSSLVGTK